MNGAIKLPSRSFKILNILKILQNKKCYLKKTSKKNFEFKKKNGMYAKEPYQVHIRTKF